jgi:hypothetical protein
MVKERPSNTEGKVTGPFNTTITGVNIWSR